MIYLKLFISYLKIGFFGFGGGYAMLSLIQNEVVVQNAWMSNAEFADIVAISQMTPNTGANIIATTIGCIPRKAASIIGLWRICEKKIATTRSITNEGITTPARDVNAPL